MVKHIHITLEDKKHQKIKEIKGPERTWDEFLEQGAKLLKYNQTSWTEFLQKGLQLRKNNSGGDSP